MRKIKIQKIILAGLLIVIAVLIPARQAHAIFGLNFIGDVTTDVVAKLSLVVAHLFSRLGGVLFVFAANLANFVLGLNYNVYNVNIADPFATPTTAAASTTNIIVSLGWRIARDVTNLGFVLVIVVIALATILRREEYGMQKLLPKLIAAAILVNFSLTIAGVFVDFSHVLTKFFFDKVSLGGSGGIADVLAGAFQPQSYFQTGQEQINTDTNSFEILGNAFLNLSFVIIFTLVGAFTILAFAFLLLIRYLHLSFLGVIAPVVWLFWVIPQLSGQFGKWWSSFLRWTFFAPASAFFMYLALSAVTRLAALNTSNSPVFARLESSLSGILAKGANIIVITGMMLGALIIADKMGIKGASGAMALGSRAGGAIKGWVGAKTASGLRGARDRAITAGAGAKITKGRSLLELTAGGLRATPGLGWAGRGLSTWSSNAKARLGKGVEDRIGKGKNETDENILSAARASAGGMTDITGKGPRAESADRVAANGILVAQRGMWDKLSGKEQERITDAVRRTGKKDLLLAQRPDLAKNLEERKDDEIIGSGDETRPDPAGSGKTVEQVKDRKFESRVLEKWVGKLEDPTKLSAEVLAKIAPYLRPGHIEKIGKEGSVEQKEKVSKALESAVGAQMKAIQDLNATIDQLTKDIDDDKNSGVDATIIAAKVAERKRSNRELKIKIDGLDSDESRALRTHDTVAENVNWKKFVTKGTVLPSAGGTTRPPPSGGPTIPGYQGNFPP